jgi:hypothetical protein
MEMESVEVAHRTCQVGPVGGLLSWWVGGLVGAFLLLDLALQRACSSVLLVP